MFAINMICVIFANGWPLFNVLQLMCTLSILGMPFSPNADLVLKAIWKFMNLMMAPLGNSVNDQMFGTPETAAMEYLKYHCAAFVLLVIPAAAVISTFTYLLCNSLKRIDNAYTQRIGTWIEATICFRLVFRTFIACFMQLSIIAFAGFGSHGPNSHIGSVLLSFGCVTVGACFAAFLFAMTATKEFLENQQVRNMVGTIYDDLKTNAGRLELLETCLFFARRIAFVIVLIQDLYIIKFGAVVALTLLQLSYILSVKPYHSKARHLLEIFNETMLMCTIYFLPLFTDFVQDPVMRFNLSWAFNCALLIPLFAVNLTYTVYTGTKSICNEIKAM